MTVAERVAGIDNGRGAAAIAPADLAELLAAFNEVTARLQSSHDQLNAEVARLTHELGDANAQLERSRRLAALGEMAAGIAHEVRNPLGSIRLYARMLEQDLADRPREQVVAAKITGAARVMDAVVGDVLAFAREFRLRPTEVEVGELFDRVLESCCHDGVPGWRRVEIVREDRRRGPVTLEGDAALLMQAMVNIARNAFEAMAETPGREHRLVLDAARRRAPDSCVRMESVAVLSVQDTGPGVTPDVVSRMFNPFFTTRGAGTGLGLAIVHRIVDAHGGRVTVRNNEASGEGFGATVEVLLPAEPVNGAEAVTAVRKEAAR